MAIKVFKGKACFPLPNYILVVYLKHYSITDCCKQSNSLTFIYYLLFPSALREKANFARGRKTCTFLIGNTNN